MAFIRLPWVTRSIPVKREKARRWKEEHAEFIAGY
jgi:hypothetical protein